MNMKLILSTLFFSLSMMLLLSIQSIPAGPATTIYLIPGQGADERLFKNLELDSSFRVIKLHHCIPDKGMTLPEYARKMAKQIDTTKPFILIGVSLGGMTAVEMSEFLHPKKIILISSAKCRQELPGRYRFQRYIPLYKVVPGRVARGGAKILQPLVEPDRKKEKETCKKMLKDKDPKFMHRSIAMIMKWERDSFPTGIIHIHGDNDHTIPIKNVACTHRIEGGSHMMVLTRSKEISTLINQVLNE
jgi:pimeloyl-ACP methyl ester carboxylesterase